MNGAPGEFVSHDFVILPNTAPQPLAQTLRLRSQHTPIRGVSVDGEHGAADVYVYPGTSVRGVPYVVHAGTARAFGIEDCAAIYVVVTNLAQLGPGASGSIRVTAYSYPVVGFGIGTGASSLAALVTNLAELNTTAQAILEWLQAHP